MQKSMGRNGKEMKNLFKNYHMYSNIYIKTVQIHWNFDRKQKTHNKLCINIAPMASKKLLLDTFTFHSDM